MNMFDSYRKYNILIEHSMLCVEGIWLLLISISSKHLHIRIIIIKIIKQIWKWIIYDHQTHFYLLKIMYLGFANKVKFSFWVFCLEKAMNSYQKSWQDVHNKIDSTIICHPHTMYCVQLDTSSYSVLIRK